LGNGGLAVPTAMRSRNPRAQCVSERKSRDEYSHHCRERYGVHAGASACGMRGAHEHGEKDRPKAVSCTRHVGFDQAAVNAIVFLRERR
jgi:hypothetical protein